jgi:hypothetical protein
MTMRSIAVLTVVGSVAAPGEQERHEVVGGGVGDGSAGPLRPVIQRGSFPVRRTVPWHPLVAGPVATRAVHRSVRTETKP